MNRNITSNNFLLNRSERQPSRINMPKEAFFRPLWNKENNPNDSSNSSSNTSPEIVEHTPIEQLNRNINQLARERRRQILLAQQNNTNECSTSTDFENSDHNYNYYEQSTPPGTDGIIINHKMNCYTIINQHYNVAETTDSDENHNNAMKLIRYFDDEYERQGDGTEDPDVLDRKNLWARPYRHKLNTIEQILLAQDSESPWSDDYEEYNDTNDGHVRIPTPLPNDIGYQRLNRADLINTLPTVTEISEVKSTQDVGCQNSLRSLNVSAKNTINGWFSGEESEKSTMTEKLTKQDKETNFSSPVPFSPRQRRRFTLNQPTHSFRLELPPLKEGGPFVIDMKHAQSESPQELKNRKDIGDISNIKTPTSEDKSVITENVDCQSEKVSTDDYDTFRELQIGSVIDLENKVDMNREMRTFEAKINPLIRPKTVTSRLERLDTDSWMNDKDDDDTEHRLLAKNMGLLKAANWSAYQIVTRSHMSLDISLAGTDYIDEIPWWRKLFDCVFCRH